ncbi:MAG: universal stress protein [Planctomycetota bacterium]
MITLDRILVPTDFSEGSEQARAYACELASRFTVEIHLLHVVPPTSFPSYVAPIPDHFFHLEESARQELEQWDDPALENASNVVRSVSMGTPFVDIVRYAREKEVDLIVIGTHGRSGLSHALIGSVTEKVVRKAECPVLSVRPKGHQFVKP